MAGMKQEWSLQPGRWQRYGSIMEERQFYLFSGVPGHCETFVCQFALLQWSEVFLLKSEKLVRNESGTTFIPFKPTSFLKIDDPWYH